MSGLVGNSRRHVLSCRGSIIIEDGEDCESTFNPMLFRHRPFWGGSSSVVLLVCGFVVFTTGCFFILSC